jgi:hypothetical protein
MLSKYNNPIYIATISIGSEKFESDPKTNTFDAYADLLYKVRAAVNSGSIHESDVNFNVSEIKKYKIDSTWKMFPN